MHTPINIAAAQFAPTKGDVAANIRIHERLAVQAAAQGADVVIFPELSLTGYEPELADSLTFGPTDNRLNSLRQVAKAQNILIVAGAPILSSKGMPYLGAFLIFPDGSLDHYCKVHLHPGEDNFFSSGNDIRVIRHNGARLGISICADSGHPIHARKNVEAGAEFYLCSVLVSKNGYPADTSKLRMYAQEHRIPVVMSNYCGPTGGWEPFGHSAVWDEHGHMLAQASEKDPALVFLASTADGRVGTVLPIRL